MTWRTLIRETVDRWRQPIPSPGRLLPFFPSTHSSIDLRIVSRMLLHASLVGLAAGLAGVAFFYLLELLQWLLLEQAAGYTVLRAHGEPSPASVGVRDFRPWLLAILPAIGGLICGLISRYAVEVRGGGTDAIITSFHHQSGTMRKRVIGIKALASLLTLGTGGSGGREGPTMYIGGALGSLTGQLLQLTARERRILLVAGIAAGISAVFKTPLGAALLAVEVLYRDGFESDALIPSVFASVVSYSLAVSITGESTLFAHDGHFPFLPAHLPLYALLAVVVAAAATLFLGVFRLIRTAFTKLPGPVWIRPGIGGLALGLLSVPIILLVGNFVHIPGQGIGLLGGGYGAVQMAISGVSWLPDGWHAVLLLSVIAFAKMVATSFTIGSGGSAGDFAPSLAIGGLVGGAFGQTARILFADPAIDPGAFALVGMGAFYGGLAHVPLAAVILVCELAGSYDLLVPLMLAQGIAFVVLRNRSLYEAQESDHIHSPVRRPDRTTDLLKTIPVEEAALKNRSFARFQPSDPIEHITAECRAHPDQEIFPVVKGDGTIRGIISWSSVATASSNRDFLPWIIASDVMQPPVAVFEGNDLRAAVELLAANGIRQIPVVNSEARLTALLTQEDIVTAWARVSTHPVQPETRP